MLSRANKTNETCRPERLVTTVI